MSDVEELSSLFSQTAYISSWRAVKKNRSIVTIEYARNDMEQTILVESHRLLTATSGRVYARAQKNIQDGCPVTARRMLNSPISIHDFREALVNHGNQVSCANAKRFKPEC